jgi:hypothetical protein
VKTDWSVVKGRRVKCHAYEQHHPHIYIVKPAVTVTFVYAIKFSAETKIKCKVFIYTHIT